MTAKQSVVKHYILRLSTEDCEQLKADASEAGERSSDSQVAAALHTSTDTGYRTRQQLVEGGVTAALTHTYLPNSAHKRIFDDAAEAKLIALACSPPPAGRKRWTLTVLEGAVVELNIFEHASDNTIGRTLKKHTQAAPSEPMGHSAGAGAECQLRSQHGGCAGGLSAPA